MRRLKCKNHQIVFWAIVLFLLCYFMQFLNFPNELTVLLGGVLCGVLVFQQRILRVDIGICLLAFTMFSYYVILNGSEGLFYSILYIPLVMYELGNYLICSVKDDKEKHFLLLVGLIVLGYTVHGILNSYMWYAGYAVPGTRRWPDFWSGEIVPGTQHSAYFIPAMVMFVPAVLYFKQNKFLNGLLIAITIFFGYTALATRSRMSVLIFALVCFVQAILFCVYEKELIKKQLKNKWVWIACGTVIAGLCMVAFAMKDSMVITAFIENMSKGGGIIHNVRFKAQRLALQQLFLYPMGGNMMDLGGISHSHNTWLDIANAAGLLPFFAFSFYTFYCIFKLCKLVKRKEISSRFKIIIAGMYAAFFLYFSVEPVLEASVHLMTPWFFMAGMTQGMISRNCGNKDK